VFNGTFSTNRLYRAIRVWNISHRAGGQHKHIIQLNKETILSLHFNSHFPGEPGYPVFIEAKDDGGGGDNWTTGAISCAKLQSNHYHQQTNIHFLQAGCPSCHPKKNSVKALNGKISHSMDLLTPRSPGSLPTLSLTTNRQLLVTLGRFAMPLISPLMPVPKRNNKIQEINKHSSAWALWRWSSHHGSASSEESF